MNNELNKHSRSIAALTKALQARHDYSTAIDDVRGLLTVDEINGVTLNEQDSAAIMAGEKVLATGGVIEQKQHVGSAYRCGDVQVYLHNKVDSAPSVLISQLCKEIGTKAILRGD